MKTTIEWTGTIVNLKNISTEQADRINNKMWKILTDDVGSDWEDLQTVIHQGYTFNPWWGCQKVSRACENCYAETLANRWMKEEKLWRGNRRKFPDKHWQHPVRWNEYAGQIGLRLKVFCASMADVFEDREDLNSERERLWKLIEQTPNLEWLILTKRPENIKDMTPMIWNAIEYPSNVAIGITTEDQEQFDKRVPYLMKTGAKVKFVSAEPLAGPIDIGENKLDWVITGGESGPKAQPSNPLWFKSLIYDCNSRGIPVLFKQWGEWTEHPVIGKKQGKINYQGQLEISKVDKLRLDQEELKKGIRIVSRVGKKAAGNKIAGQTIIKFADHHEKRKYLNKSINRKTTNSE